MIVENAINTHKDLTNLYNEMRIKASVINLAITNLEKEKTFESNFIELLNTDIVQMKT